MALRVVIESRYAAATRRGVGRNVKLAKNACRYAALRGFNPCASHLFYTQFLDDYEPSERALGIELGLQASWTCDEAWVIRRDGEGLSAGQKIALERHSKEARRIRFFTTNDNGETLYACRYDYDGTPMDESLPRCTSCDRPALPGETCCIRHYQGPETPEQRVGEAHP